ncbi:cell envelope biogenesis protein OmpA [Persicobacter psychrovividus]|uniref:Cell envelope biogenesis protein OmpA n=2 Tax=Persicobacter psychrovividus TaxID=387638 RepID=A0ABM7VGW4_9BACT|nr:cell envelope biogenesis protein OmpA [Persicobacter psychrovividus]
MLLLICSLSGCFLQNMSLKKGHKKFDDGEYNIAIKHYKKQIASGKEVAEANYHLAEAYRLSNRTKEALPYYEAALKSGVPEEMANYYYAKSLVANQKYKEAKDHLTYFLQGAKDEEVIDICNNYVDNLTVLMKEEEEEPTFKVKNLEAINTEFAEYAPVYTKGKLYFTSNKAGNDIYRATGTPFTHIWTVKTKGARVEMETAEQIKELYSNGANEGTITFSPDGKTMIFARGNTGRRKGTNDVNLYETKFRKGKWSEPKMIAASDPQAWDSAPAFSPDGKLLYFASNRKGGMGGTDIYVASKDGRGRWGNVRNLGNKINTADNESFPYLSDAGKLYFASEGHPGFGGLDLFVAERKDGKLQIRNLGKPVNSPADDFGIFLFSLNKGFFSSNREGGAGDDDIYTFVNSDPQLKVVNYYLTGTAVTINDEGTEEILADTQVKLMDANGEVLGEATANEDGKFKFRVYPAENYTLFGAKTDYLTSRTPFSTVGKTVSQDRLVKKITNVVFEKKIILEPIVLDKPIVLENIYYDFDKAEIREDAAVELDKLTNLLNDNPKIRIELGSHTDSRGEAAYNADLSQRRANSAVAYLIKSGIAANRLKAKGYGESTPIAANTNEDGSDNPEGRQKNRRTEFKIIGLDAKKNADGQVEYQSKDLEERFFGGDDEDDEGQ